MNSNKRLPMQGKDAWLCPAICLIAVSSAWSLSHAIGGYVDELPFISIPSTDESGARVDNLLESRLNTQWFPWAPVTIEASGRVLWYGGKDFNDAGAIASELGVDPAYLQLSRAQGTNGIPTVLYENLDRLSVELTEGSLTTTLGRQRINWGTDLVWNPDDWFNAFNYLDFEYPEHPGTDALRLQYYPNATSVAELALQAGKVQRERTFAALYKLNKWAYDWQFQAGVSGDDLAAGFSWSGSVHGGGFRGEVSWYDPAIDTGARGRPVVVASVSGDYTFPNSLYIQIAGLYNGFGAPESSAVALSTIGSVTAKSLIPKRYALFGEAACQLTALVRLDFASSVSPTDGSLYLAPSVTVSVLDNLDVLALGQVFHGREGDLYGGVADIIAVSSKLSF